MTYFPEETVQYVTYIKNSMVDALQAVFDNHPDPMLKQAKASIEYPKTQAEFPSVIIRFFERDISNAGVGHEETLVTEGETLPSSEIAVTVNGSQAINLTWTHVPEATLYRVYRGTSSGVQNVVFETKEASFRDIGWGSTEGHVPDTNTTPLSAPTGLEGAVYGLGNLMPGTYYYRVTAVRPSQAWKFKHYFYTGDIEFAIYALSSYDRDLVRDTIVQTITMGKLETWTNRFFERVYPDPETGVYPYSWLHFISPNTDTLQGFGESQQQVTWGDEDNLLYMASYRLGMMGEIYSLPPNISYDLVRAVFFYPYIEGVEDKPQGDPGNANEWQSFF